MRLTVTILGRLLLVALAAFLLATAARAEEPSALEQLTPEERAHLERQVAGWDELSADRQEKIARSVVHIRALPEEKRRALLERIQRLKRGREAGRGPRPGRLKHQLDPRRRPSHRQRGHVMRAVGAVLWAELPEATRLAIDDAFEERDRERVAMMFFRRLVGRIARQRAEEGVPTIPLLPDASPESIKRLEALRAQAAGGDERALDKLAHISVFQDLHHAAAELGRDGPPAEAAVRRLGAQVRERYPEAFAASVAELTEAASSPASLERYAPPPPRGPHGRHSGSPEHQARRLLETLEQSGGLLRKHPALKEHVRQLKRELRKILGNGPAPERAGPGRRPGGSPGPGGRRGPPGGGRGPRRGAQRPPDAPPPGAPPPDDQGR